jgi:hypothetical protein
MSDIDEALEKLKEVDIQTWSDLSYCLKSVAGRVAARLLELDDENKRLKVCGNCQHMNWCGMDVVTEDNKKYVQDGAVGWCLAGEIAPRVIPDAHPNQRCVFNPPRWAAHAPDEGGEG